MDLKYFIKTIWEGKGDAKEARVEIEKLGDAADKAAPKQKRQTDATSMMGGALTKLIATGVFLEAGRQVLKFGADSIAAASDVEEMQSKFNTVFAQEAPRVTSALGDFADAANRSKTELMGYAATLQDTFVPLGFARDEAADMSVQLVKLAEDLASFNNLNTDEVVRDLQSALVGNTETLRKYGVVAQETQIKQEALNSGLWDGVGYMDAQTKAQAILQLTLKGTTDAQGDAIKTADSYANVSKGLEAAVLDLKVAIGEGLLPTMTNAKTEMAGVVGAMGNFWSASNALRMAEEDGIITHGEYIKIQAQLTYGSMEAADVQELLTSKYSAVERELARQVETASQADVVLQNYYSTIDEGVPIVERASDMAGAMADKIGQQNGHLSENEALIRAANAANEEYFNTAEEILGPMGAINEALVAQNAGMTAVAQNAAYVETLQTMGENTDIQADKVANLTMKILGIPPEYGSKINVDTSAAESKINRLRDLLGSLGAARAVAPEVDDIGGGGGGGADDYDPLNRATGGPVLGGRPYRVGENGPEIFVPATSGRIDNGAGGIGGVTIEMDLRGAVIASQQQLQGWMQAAMAQAGRQTDVRMRT